MSLFVTSDGVNLKDSTFEQIKEALEKEELFEDFKRYFDISNCFPGVKSISYANNWNEEVVEDICSIICRFEDEYGNPIMLVFEDEENNSVWRYRYHFNEFVVENGEKQFEFEEALSPKEELVLDLIKDDTTSKEKAIINVFTGNRKKSARKALDCLLSVFGEDYDECVEEIIRTHKEAIIKKALSAKIDAEVLCFAEKLGIKEEDIHPLIVTYDRSKDKEEVENAFEAIYHYPLICFLYKIIKENNNG